MNIPDFHSYRIKKFHVSKDNENRQSASVSVKDNFHEKWELERNRQKTLKVQI